MGFFVCRCQNTIDLKGPPDDSNANFMLDSEEEEIIEAFTKQVANFIAAVASGKRTEWITEALSVHRVDASDKAIVYALLMDHTRERCRSMLECPACGRIYVEGRKQDSGYLSFRPEPVVLTPEYIAASERSEHDDISSEQARTARDAWRKIWFGVDADVVPDDTEDDYGRLINSERHLGDPH